MSELSEFEVAKFKKFATEFVTHYIEDGRLAAGNYAVLNTKKEQMPAIKPFVDEEFLRRGYTFDE